MILETIGLITMMMWTVIRMITKI